VCYFGALILINTLNNEKIADLLSLVNLLKESVNTTFSLFESVPGGIAITNYKEINNFNNQWINFLTTNEPPGKVIGGMRVTRQVMHSLKRNKNDSQ
jgi:hypothetical protein